MKKVLSSILVSLSFVVAGINSANANTISQDGIYVTLSPESYTSVSSSGYGNNKILAQFSLSSQQSVTVHIVVKDRNGKIEADTWVTLTPDKNNKASVWIPVSFSGKYYAELIQH